MEEFQVTSLMTQTHREPREPRILIVEDDVTMKPLWTFVIERVRPKASIKWVVSEESAERAILQRIRYEEAFDLVISDVFLAGSRTGIDLWRRHSHGPSQFLLTSIVTPEKFANLVGEGLPVPFYVQKPLHVETCIESLRLLFATSS